MKKFLSALCFMVSFASFIKAQDLHFGFQASPTWSWMRTDNSKINGVGSVLGLKLGLIAESRFSEAYSISSGIGFHFNTGGKLRLDAPSRYWSELYADEFDVRPPVNRPDSAVFGKDALFKYNLTYVEIPVGLKMRTPESGNHVRWLAEPQLTLGFRSNARGAVESAGSLNQERISIKEVVSGFNLSWGIGGGGEYIISNNTAIVVGLYFQSGFANVTSNSGDIIFDADGKSNPRAEKSKGVIRGLSLRMGVMF